jgi:hypothetical protein
VREDGKETTPESPPKAQPNVDVMWDRVAIVVVALAAAGLLGFFALLFIFRVLFPW